MSDSAHTFLIGVDGGGTGCRAVIGTHADGPLAQAEGGRANVSTDPQGAISNIIAVVEKAATSAGLPKTVLRDAVAHLGLAGVMTDRDSAYVAAALPFARSIVTDDKPTAVTGALGGADGYLLAVGTGTILACNKAGEFKSVGGWGLLVSDQASGAWLGRSALEHVLLCHDGLMPHSELTRTILAGFDDAPHKIVSFSLTAKPGDYGAFAPQVVSAARDGDQWGRSIMKAGAEYVERGLAALGFEAGDAICLTGGVGPHYADFLPTDRLAGRIPSKGTALDGAFRLAQAAVQSEGMRV